MKDGVKTIKLQYPIVLNGRDDITEVKLRRFRAKDLKFFPASFLDVDQDELSKARKKDGTIDVEKIGAKIDIISLIPLIASICDLSEEVLDEMDLADLITVASSMDVYRLGK